MQKVILLSLASACFVRADIVVTYPIPPGSFVNFGEVGAVFCDVRAGSAEIGLYASCQFDNTFPGFKDVVSVLTNGIDDPFYAVFTDGYGSTQAPLDGPESVVFAKYTKNGVDLAGYNIKSISLVSHEIFTPYTPVPGCPPDECGWLDVSGTVDLVIGVPEYASPLEVAILPAVVLGVAASARRRCSLAGPRARWRL